MKGAPKHGRHRRADPQARSHSDALAYYRARASQPKPATAFDAEWASLSRAERNAAAGARAGRINDADLRINWGSWTSYTTTTLFISKGGVFTLYPRKPFAELESAGLTVGEIVAHRVWRIDESYYLRSGFRDDIWAPGSPMVGDPTGDHGVHAFKDDDEARILGAVAEYGPRRAASWFMALLPDERPESKTIGMAIGTVRLYGTVVEHEHGYRAQYAMIESIDRIEDCLREGVDRDNLLAALRARYLPAQTP